MQASGYLEAAAIAGKRYVTADLAALDGNSREYLKGIICDLVIWILLGRRPSRDGQMPKQVELALAAIEQLRGGERIFAFDETADAGKDVIVSDTPSPLLPERASRLFGDLDFDLNNFPRVG